MLREALQYLDQRQAEKIGYQVAINKDVWTYDGKQFFKTEIAAPPRSHILLTVASFCAAAKHYLTDEATIWINPAGATVVIDDAAYRENVLRLQLQLSVELNTVLNCKEPMTPSELRSLLRNQLYRAAPAELRDVFAHLLMMDRSAGSHTEDTVGRSVKAAIHGEAELPESLILDLHAWDGEIFRSTFELGVEFVPEMRQLRLIPRPGEISRFHLESMTWMRDSIAAAVFPGSDAPPVFFGEA